MRPFRLATLALLPLTLLSACGGGGGGSGAAPAPAPAALTLSSTTPADGATGVDRGGALEASFSAAPLPASIDGKSVQLIGPEGNAIALLADAAANRVSFRPEAGALPGATSYTLKFSTDIRSATAPLSTAATLSFSTAPAQWETAAQQVSGLPDRNWTRPWLVSDSAGGVTALWQRLDNNVRSIWASRRAAGAAAWGTPVAIYTPADEGLTSFFTAVGDARGDVYVAWNRDTNTPQGWTNASMFTRYDAAAGRWSTPATFKSTALEQPGDRPQLVVDASGTVTALTNDLFKHQLSAVRFERASGAWSSPLLLAQAPEHSLSEPEVAADGKGNLIAVWDQRRDGLQAARYDGASGQWSRIPMATLSVAGGAIALAGHPAGGFTLAWTNGAGGSVGAARMMAGETAWGAPAVISADAAQSALDPELVVSTAGTATLVFGSSTGVKAARSGAGQGTWAMLPPLRQDMSTYTAPKSLGVDGAGNVSLLYVHNGMLTAAEYAAPGTQWRSTAVGAGLKAPSIRALTATHTVHRSGDITAVWTEADDVLHGGVTPGAVIGSKRLR